MAVTQLLKALDFDFHVGKLNFVWLCSDKNIPKVVHSEARLTFTCFLIGASDSLLKANRVAATTIKKSIIFITLAHSKNMLSTLPRRFLLSLWCAPCLQ